jgi:uncharacterized protein YuzE
MRISYDPTADAAYIRRVDPIEVGSSVEQVIVPPDVPGSAQFILDLVAEGSLLGVEVLSASLGLRRETLASAQRPK